ncbi:MAG: ATP-dependent DNA helicase [Desulfuromonadales bacterium]|nr:ATP-dependent DNA helicase [Desulfuromonadales bacterium]
MSYQVAVRALCEFTAKAGDLDLRFTPSPTAQEGVAGHVVVASRRGAGYQAELALSGGYRGLLVRGRADGYDPALNRLEEVKTYRGDLSRMPDNHRQLHWAQAKIYGWLQCQALGLAEIRLALVYYDILSQQETVFTESFPAPALRQFFEEQCERFLAWAKQEVTHRTARDQALLALPFPYPSFRTGQRPLAEAVYKTVTAGRCLLAEAPTGIGKTIGTLFPMFKALPGQQLDKIFFLAAKTPGRTLALEAARQIEESAPGLTLRVLELVARDKACEHPDLACHGESCPLASGFYDRLPAARQAALNGALLDQSTVQAVAREHQLCPYYLSQELARWADLVVGDYNYYFDLTALLYSFTVANQWRVGVLVDEAHNLVTRARQMYTVELDQAVFRRLRRSAPALLKKSLDRVNRGWNAACREQDDPYQVYDRLPAKLLSALQKAVADITDYLTEEPSGLDPTLQDFYFTAMHFCRLAELLDENFLFDIKVVPATPRPHSVLCIRNLVPAPFLAPRFEAAHSIILFSATLRPGHYYRNLLGLPPDSYQIDVESPFSADQLSVRISRVSTRFQHRGASLAPIVALMAGQFACQPGNYLAFFSSFDYLEQVAGLFEADHPQIPIWRQVRQMDESGRRNFLAQFTPTSQGIGFAVLGGAFGEGIDLPGERLIGAFIATLGLPQVNPVNEQIRRRMGALFGAGYDYTYFYPGVQKVVQAAGRVIRTPQDRGVVFLIDDRFARPEVLRLLPRWWGVVL